MISRVTLRPLIWTFKLASRLQITSFDWDDETQTLVLKADELESNKAKTLSLRFLLGYNKAMRLFNIIYRISGIVFIALNLLLRTDIIAHEVLLSMCFLVIFCLTLPTLVLFLIWDGKLVSDVNALLLLNFEMCKFKNICMFLCLQTVFIRQVFIP